MTRYRVWIETAHGTDLYHVTADSVDDARSQMDGPDVHTIRVEL